MGPGAEAPNWLNIKVWVRELVVVVFSRKWMALCHLIHRAVSPNWGDSKGCGPRVAIKTCGLCGRSKPDKCWHHQGQRGVVHHWWERTPAPYLCLCICVYLCVRVFANVCMFVHALVCASVQVCWFVDLFVHVCVYTCTCVSALISIENTFLQVWG